eukprot:TRINITY_DN109904_c0_g1_i1.p1 TRINITY_DN109904_c0_g1~~TRINITY_DN109904_c0_g1_i1.p1  ORF type:complete len:185 (-),score=31.23 TRINITY_DN109904_c0_g1_i1:111-665(-)
MDMSRGATPRGATPRGATPRGSGVATPRMGSREEGPLSGEGVMRNYGLTPRNSRPPTSDQNNMAPANVADFNASAEEAARVNRTEETEKSMEEAMREMRKFTTRDSVAFLLGRAPFTSHPPQFLKDLEARTPRGIICVTSTTKTAHGLESLEGAAATDRTNMRQRDRQTEYAEAMMLQSHIIRK